MLKNVIRIFSCRDKREEEKVEECLVPGQPLNLQFPSSWTRESERNDAKYSLISVKDRLTDRPIK